MARTTSSSSSSSSPHRRRAYRGRTKQQRYLAERVVAWIALVLLLLGLLAWIGWRLALWFQEQPLVGWLGGALLLVLLGLGYGVLRLRFPVPRWWRMRHVYLTRYYGERATLQRLQTMDPVEFERYVGHLFELEGYRVTYTRRTGDGGVDILLYRPGQNWRRGGEVGLVQCKRYGPRHPVGSPELQKFSGALRHALAHEGYFVTTSHFTPDARKWAQDEGIHLIDGEALLRWHQRLERRLRLRWLVSGFREVPDLLAPEADQMPMDE